MLIPKLNEFGIFPKVLTETKKDGRVFSYLYVSKYKGAFAINDPTKVYYLGNLSDEQRKELITKNVGIHYKSISDANFLEYYNYVWNFVPYKENLSHFINALTLSNSNQRIVEIQVHIQELNNELIELDNEMRELTYG